MKVICFDLEGPISPQDNAYEVMGLIENGHKIFEVISRYDDILTLEGRENYEPGDTLKLIVPFLLYHKLRERDIRKISDNAIIVKEVKEVISKLEKGWEVYIISTSYQQHAFNIGKKVGVSEKNIFCTKLPLDSFYKRVTERDFSMLKKVEEKILQAEEEITEFLDDFYYRNMPKTALGGIMNEIWVVGGSRKVDALERVSEVTKTDLKEIVVVGDSITDFKMLQKVRDADGLSIVFNGNEYAIPYGNVGIADDNMEPLLKVVDTYSSNGLGAVKDLSQKEKSLQWLMGLTDEKIKEIIALHKKYRKLVRGGAAKLG